MLTTAKVISDNIDKILSREFSTTSDIDITFQVNKGKDSYKFSLLETVKIVHHFSTNYSEVFTIKGKMSVKAYMELVENRQELWVRVNWNRVNEFDGSVTAPVMDKMFVANIKNPIDLRSSHSSNTLESGDEGDVTEAHISNTMDIEIELLDPDFYLLRKAAVRFITKNTTMYEVIRKSLSILGYDKVNIYPPDNTKVYKNFVMPSVMGIDKLFDFLQHGPGNGVYNNDIRHFYFEGVMYVYPGCKLGEYHDTINVFRAGQNEITGSSSYHVETDVDINIATDEPIVMSNEVHVNLENLGNAYLVNPTDLIYGDWITHVVDHYLIGNNPYVLETGGSVAAGVDAPRSTRARVQSIRENSFSPKFIETQANVFGLTGELAARETTHMALQWNMSLPYKIKPFHKMSVWYDELGIVKEIQGTPVSVVYTAEHTVVNLKRLFTATTAIGMEIPAT